MFNKINKKDVLIKQEFDRINNRITCISKDNKAQHKNIFAIIHKEMDDKISRLPAFPELVECDVCGCLLKKETAIRGQSRVKEPELYNLYGHSIQFGTEQIEEVYYCKKHAPKVKTEKK